MVCHQGTHSPHVPDVMLVRGGVGPFASPGVALVGKLPVAVETPSTR